LEKLSQNAKITKCLRGKWWDENKKPLTLIVHTTLKAKIKPFLDLETWGGPKGLMFTKNMQVLDFKFYLGSTMSNSSHVKVLH